MLVFEEREKLDYLKKKLSEQGENQQRTQHQQTEGETVKFPVIISFLPHSTASHQ